MTQAVNEGDHVVISFSSLESDVFYTAFSKNRGCVVGVWWCWTVALLLSKTPCCFKHHNCQCILHHCHFRTSRPWVLQRCPLAATLYYWIWNSDWMECLLQTGDTDSDLKKDSNKRYLNTQLLETDCPEDVDKGLLWIISRALVAWEVSPALGT